MLPNWSVCAKCVKHKQTPCVCPSKRQYPRGAGLSNRTLLYFLLMLFCFFKQFSIHKWADEDQKKILLTLLQMTRHGLLSFPLIGCLWTYLHLGSASSSSYHDLWMWIVAVWDGRTDPFQETWPKGTLHSWDTLIITTIWHTLNNQSLTVASPSS